MAGRLVVPALLLLLLASSLAAAAVEEGTEKVAVALYYESLCPYSALFVVNHLAKVFENGLLDAIDLKLVPYGNAKVHAGGEISCQVRSWIAAARVSLRDFVRRVVVVASVSWVSSRLVALVNPRNDFELFVVCFSLSAGVIVDANTTEFMVSCSMVRMSACLTPWKVAPSTPGRIW